MVDLTIRQNKHCVIGQPRCDYVFQSTRRVFIAYGFEQSHFEVEILRKLLTKYDLEPIEAGGSRSPGQNAFCRKICSEIITSQFCIVLINHDMAGGNLRPNANVNMEYGLILGFNKYVLPFQLEDQSLPFNVAGLDTIKYSKRQFESLAEQEIIRAIDTTTPQNSSPVALDQRITDFLLLKQLHKAPITNEGEKNLAEWSKIFGFEYYASFSGIDTIFMGIFTNQRSEQVLHRILQLSKFWIEKCKSIDERRAIGLINEFQVNLFTKMLSKSSILVIVSSEKEKTEIQQALVESKFQFFAWTVFSLEDVNRETSSPIFG